VKIVKIEIAECRLPISRPIKLGPVSIRTRDFVVLRLTTDNGIKGDALGYTRGTPLLRTAEHIGEFFLGANPLEREGTIHDFRRSMMNGGAAFVRAISLFDIALTDATAKFLELPLFRLLGGNRTRIPALGVAGYHLNERSVESISDEVSQLFDKGFTRAKIMLAGNAPAEDRKLVEACFRVAGGALAADAHWSWQSVAEAMETCRGIDDLGLLFLEDPFGPNMPAHLSRLRSFLRTPLAAGEDSADIASLVAIGNATTVLRVDATTCGGIGAAVRAIHAGGLAGCDIFPHVHHHLHAHLAGSMPEIRFVEIIPEDTGADPAHLLLQQVPLFENGFVDLDETPGAGCDLNWANVQQYATTAVTVQ
jgi:L-alanine-DL-glutamate epimerase-like enolase superfamily enzyme